MPRSFDQALPSRSERRRESFPHTLTSTHSCNTHPRFLRSRRRRANHSDRSILPPSCARGRLTKPPFHTAPHAPCIPTRKFTGSRTSNNWNKISPLTRASRSVSRTPLCNFKNTPYCTVNFEIDVTKQLARNGRSLF